MLKELYKKYIVDKNLKNIFFLSVIGIAFIIISSFSGFNKTEDKKTNESAQIDMAAFKKQVIKELTEIILKIDGVSKVNVMISFSDSGKKEYYINESIDIKKDEETSNQRSEKEIALKRNSSNEIPIVIREINPEIKGVTVIADCNKGNDVKYLIYKAVKAIGVDAHKIEVIINDRSR